MGFPDPDQTMPNSHPLYIHLYKMPENNLEARWGYVMLLPSGGILRNIWRAAPTYDPSGIPSEPDETGTGTGKNSREREF
jgi:hypothetical protein